MKISAYLTILLIFVFILPSSAFALITGVQIPSEQAITRLSTSSYKFEWVKYQYTLGSQQDLYTWLRMAADNNYKILISVAKNEFGAISPLPDPPPKPCPYPEELDDIIVGYDQYRQPIWGKEPMPESNGYMKFRDIMQDLVQMKISPASGSSTEELSFRDVVSAIELWNEPNTKDEWNNQGLGEISPIKYATFLNCGAKGARRGGYQGILISAGLAPLSGDYDDLRFFHEFVNAGGLDSVNMIGWHGNVVKNISPTDPNIEGFQRVREALDHGKPVWMTEYGWRRDGASLNREIQAKYIAESVQVAQRLGNIEAMFVWNYGFGSENPDPDFKNWDIEDTNYDVYMDEGECLPEDVWRREYPNASDINAPTLRDDDIILSIENQALIPEQVNQEIAASYQTTDTINAPVQIGFFDGILGFVNGLFQSIFGTCPENIGPFKVSFCTPYVALGNVKDVLKDDPLTKSQITNNFASRSGVLARSRVPDQALKAEKKDCNILLTDSTLNQATQNPADQIGNEQINKISEGMGTNAGFFGADTAPLTDFDDQVKEKMKVDNLSIGTKLFIRDKRVPDMDTRQEIFYQKFYPEGIKPFYISPPPTTSPKP